MWGGGGGRDLSCISWGLEAELKGAFSVCSGLVINKSGADNCVLREAGWLGVGCGLRISPAG